VSVRATVMRALVASRSSSIQGLFVYAYGVIQQGTDLNVLNLNVLYLCMRMDEIRENCLMDTQESESARATY
jgi:hypothetical protein